YGVDVEKLNKGEVVDWVARAISDYMQTLKSGRATPFDRFVKLNGLNAGPEAGEDPKRFASRFIKEVADLENLRALKLPAGFDSSSLAGMKIFFQTDRDKSAGNCVACHTPPMFTDASFHNIGLSQSEYDQVNGEGSFARLEIPSAAAAQRPSTQF